MRILLAEDESALANALVTIFRHAGFSIDTVNNGIDAVDYITTGIYDVVILDIMMPGRDGIEVLKTVRKDGCNAPILMLTAKAEIEDRILGLDSGADDYLTKPFSPKELLARVRALTRRPKTDMGSVLSFGNLSLDRKSFEISTKSGCFKLGNKEFQLMEMLMLHPKNLFSAEHFMEKIWGFESEAEINIVRVYISYLRKKLTTLSADVYIKSNRNIGYSLEMNQDD